MTISPYQKSLWFRNLLLMAVAAALITAAWKIGGSLQKIELYEQAHAYYEANQLIAAEEAFSRANEYAGIDYGDDAWNTFMSGLTGIRQELESLSRQAKSAMAGKQEDGVLQTYRRYQSLRQEIENRRDAQTGIFFQSISARLELEKGWSDYYAEAIRQAKQQFATSPDDAQRALIHTLVLVPAEFYGGEKQKQQKLDELFQPHETAKLRKQAASLPFPDVISRTAQRIAVYKSEGIAAEWLQQQLEDYAKKKIRQAIQRQDVSGFAALAKAYREIKDVLPADSAVLTTIERHLESLIEQASEYTRKHRFAQAAALYQELGGLVDTSTLLADLEKRWTQDDPARLLRQKYPDKRFDTVLTGSGHWGADVYAIGVDEKERRISFAAALPESDTPVFFEQALDGAGDFTLTLSELQDDEHNPILLVQTAGKERAYMYMGLVPQLAQRSLDMRFSLEADDLSIENATQAIVKNAAGKGERELAVFQLDEDGLVYSEKLADLLPDKETAPEPGGTDTSPDGPGDSASDSPVADVHTGPGHDYPIIGQISLDSSPQIVTELSGWYQIRFDGQEGWIEAPQTEP
ncbi:SH3 domain-containing protein [Brevibacillus sp. GCM10020057]|uniref:SH3 domain-containing protein n=1 Tax=Brevibacillus sp. GCM10020057 TaxID=3317327 RepID=UPI00362EC6DC